MDTSDIGLPATLKIWHGLGLQYLYRPDSCQAKTISETCVEAGHSQTSRKTSSSSALDKISEHKTQMQVSFPQPWQQLWEKLSPPHHQVWTYWELPVDLENTPNLHRRALWRKILAALKWPSGKVAFWPMSAFTNGVLKPELSTFWNGIQKIQPQFIVCFGQGAFCRIFANRTFQYGYFTHNYHHILVLPGPGDMLPDNKAAKMMVWEFLSTIKV